MSELSVLGTHMRDPNKPGFQAHEHPGRFSSFFGCSFVKQPGDELQIHFKHLPSSMCSNAFNVEIVKEWEGALVHFLANLQETRNWCRSFIFHLR